MGKIVLYVAQSVDGYIARENGAVDWLNLGEGEDYGFHDFFSTVDVVFMGNTTYQQVLSFEGEFPYKGKEVFVFTRDVNKQNDINATFINSKQLKYTAKIKEKTNGVCWLVGGGKTAAFFIENKLIDELRLFTIPVLLGKGIRLFVDAAIESKVELANFRQYNSGVIESVYKFL
jgi:dihydrofolate reductase